MEDTWVRAEHGRMLRIAQWGAPGGAAVAYLHGSPGSRLNRYADERRIAELGVRLITYDRPGYGDSDPNPGRDVASAAGDVRAIAKAFGLRRLPVFGHSGGASHALACAALLPGLVPRAAAIAGVAPYNATGLNWFDGFAGDGGEDFRVAATEGRDALDARLQSLVEATTVKPTAIFSDVELPAVDERLLQKTPAGDVMGKATTLSVRQGTAGWADDEMAFVRPWGFDPAAIVVPVLLMHGALDAFAPVAHARWLAATIPGVEFHLYPDEGHLSMQRYHPAVMRWLLS